MKYKLFVLTILASVGFFNYHAMFSEQMTKAMFYLCVLASLVYALKDGISLRDVNYPRAPYFLMLAGIAFSTVMASAFHSQSFVTSVIATLPYLFAYAYFWILLKFNLSIERIMNTYMVLCAISTVVYFINALTVPNNVFGEPILYLNMDRGVVRLPIVFIEFFPMIVFYGINKWLDTGEKKWIAVIAVASMMVILSVIRQIIALTAVLSLWFLLRRVSLWKKLLLILITLGVVVFVLPQIPIYKALVELSEDQRDENDDVENIRITSWRYYTYENQTNEVTAIFGNGFPSFGNSLWGKMFDSETEDNGCYAVDVGWAGFYWSFGISVFFLLALLIKAYLRRKQKNELFLNYWLVFLIITSIASGPILIYWQILDVVVCLAMVYGVKTKISDKDDKKDGFNHTEFQQLPRYPQLH